MSVNEWLSMSSVAGLVRLESLRCCTKAAITACACFAGV